MWYIVHPFASQFGLCSSSVKLVRPFFGSAMLLLVMKIAGSVTVVCFMKEVTVTWPIEGTGFVLTYETGLAN
jgi:hypothetical protein